MSCLAVILALVLVAVQDPWVPEIPAGPDPIGSIDVDDGPRGIVVLPDHVDPRIRRVFDRYTKVTAPGGQPIHILAQSGWRADQIVRARQVLEHLLTDVPGSRYGSDKAPVADAMAARRATLALFDDVEALEQAFDGPLGEVELGIQDLRANECPVEGDQDYLAHDTRDAAFEEILHLVHDYGIRPVHPDFDEALHAANLEAAAAGRWHAWPEDEPENHRNEYFAAAYDNYLDLWAVKPTRYEGEPLEDDDIPDGSSHFGAFGADGRGRLLEVDPRAFALIEEFLPETLTYTAELPADFEGRFSLKLDPALRYTAKSQHLRHVTLTGSHDAGILGNQGDNRLTGNAGDNRLEGGRGRDLLVGGPGWDVLRGGAGDDILDDGEGFSRLDGGSGTDVAVFAGWKAEWRIERQGEGVLVSRPGDVNTLLNVEVARFDDGDVDLPRGG